MLPIGDNDNVSTKTIWTVFPPTITEEVLFYGNTKWKMENM